MCTDVSKTPAGCGLGSERTTAIKTEEACSTETLIPLYQTTWRHVPEEFFFPFWNRGSHYVNYYSLGCDDVRRHFGGVCCLYLQGGIGRALVCCLFLLLIPRSVYCSTLNVETVHSSET
jgi:hypothetical protein